MLTQTQVKQILSENNIHPKKRLGQNFLIDRNIKDKIIKIADVKPSDVILEIGPGLGALTEDLAKKAKRVVAVEKDRALTGILKDLLGGYKNVTVEQGDFLKMGSKNGDTLLLKQGVPIFKVIGNLPYYITTPILSRLIENRKHINSILVTIQKEVAQRIVAGPGSKDYGSLSLYLQYYTEPTIEMTISKSCFYPQPEVSSCLVKMLVREKPPVSVKNEELLFKIIRAAFNQRRKTLANTLKPICKDIKSILESAGINPACRGETLTLEKFAQIANKIDIPA